MLENEPTETPATPAGTETAGAPATRRRRATKTASPPNAAATTSASSGSTDTAEAPVAKKAPAKRAAKKTATKRTAKPTATASVESAQPTTETGAESGQSAPSGAESAGPARRGRGRTRAAVTAANSGLAESEPSTPAMTASAPIVPTVLFQAPVVETPAPRQPGRRRAAGGAAETAPAEALATPAAPAARAVPAAAEASTDADATEGDEHDGGPRRRRRGGRGGRGRSSAAGAAGETTESGEHVAAAGDEVAAADADADHDDDHEFEHDADGTPSSRRRRRRRRRGGAGDSPSDEHAPDDPPNTVVRIREPREHEERGVQGVKGSTRLEAKKQRRREGREQIRRGRRGLVITEAEFLARRESVDRVMVVRQRGDRTQIAVLEDGILVEHFVANGSTNRMVGNVYLGRVQNVLSGMEAAFVDVGRGRNAVLYAGEVNFDISGIEGQPRRIETALKSGQTVLVQVTKDPIGHKGARLTSQVSLPGRYLVYVPEGSMMGISRKLPDVERSRLKAILKKVTPEGAGVIVRTAAEGASEEELARDVARLSAQWEDIKKKAETADAPALLYGEPDLTIRVIRDIFNEDFNSLVVQADSEWDTVEAYVGHVAPDLVSRLSRWTPEEDVFSHYRVEEQLAKALDRKVWLPSGGYLVIDRTEAMIVIDVNTGRFVGKGGNLEETVTKNNLEAAEEIVRQLRLRDIGGIIVIDFIDMVLESNRELVLRRLVECLGRDRTKHQVAEVTSLGLVQMTRKRVGTGLLEAFSETCEHCNGRGVLVHTEPIEQRPPRVLPAKTSSARPTPAKVAAGNLPAGKASAGKGARKSSARRPAAERGDDAAAAVVTEAELDGHASIDGAVDVNEGADTTPSRPKTRRGGRRRGGRSASAGSSGQATGDAASGGQASHDTVAVVAEPLG